MKPCLRQHPPPHICPEPGNCRSCLVDKSNCPWWWRKAARMVDHDAEKAEQDIIRAVEDIQKRWNVPSATLQFILENLAGKYEIKSIAEAELRSGEESVSGR